MDQVALEALATGSWHLGCVDCGWQSCTATLKLRDRATVCELNLRRWTSHADGAAEQARDGTGSCRLVKAWHDKATRQSIALVRLKGHWGSGERSDDGYGFPPTVTKCAVFDMHLTLPTIVNSPIPWEAPSGPSWGRPWHGLAGPHCIRTE